MKIIFFLICLLQAAWLQASPTIAFERNHAVWIANIDGTSEKKVADGIFSRNFAALWSFDLSSQKSTRLTPKKVFGWDAVWLDDSNVLFLSRAVGEKDDSICRMSLDGKNFKALIKNARFPSVSAR